MKKVRKDRVIILGVVIAVVIAIVALIIINPFKKEPVVDEEPEIVALPSTTYSNMEVTNVEMEYLKDNNETMVSMIIDNTTGAVVEESNFDAIWLNEAGEIIGQIETYVNTLQPGEQCSVSVILKGDLRTTAAIKLQEK